MSNRHVAEQLANRKGLDVDAHVDDVQPEPADAKDSFETEAPDTEQVDLEAAEAMSSSSVVQEPRDVVTTDSKERVPSEDPEAKGNSAAEGKAAVKVDESKSVNEDKSDPQVNEKSAAKKTAAKKAPAKKTAAKK